MEAEARSPQGFQKKTVEVFHQLKAKDFNVETIHIMKGKLRRKVQKMTEEAKERGRALWKELRRGKKSRVRKVLVKELYSGDDGGVVTALARDNEIPIGRPRDLLLGDNFLKKEDRASVLAEIKIEKPSLSKWASIVIHGHLSATFSMKTPKGYSKGLPWITWTLSRRCANFRSQKAGVTCWKIHSVEILAGKDRACAALHCPYGPVHV